MQTPDILHPIQPQQLSPKDYFRSLTAAALDCGLLTESRIGQMYAELPALLAALLMQYPNDDFLERESEQRLYCALQHRKAALTDKERQELLRYRIADEGM